MKNKPYLIAEIAQAHDGSLGIFHSYIDAVAATGVQAIKFQLLGFCLMPMIFQR